MDLKQIMTEKLISSITSKHLPVFLKATKQKSKISHTAHFSQKYTLCLLTFLYFIGFIPFRFKRYWNLVSGHFEWRIHTNIWQKVNYFRKV